MAEAKSSSKPGGVLLRIGGAISLLVAGYGGHHAIGAAQAQTMTVPAGVATAEQVSKMDAKLDRFIDRLVANEQRLAVQAEQIRQLEGVTNAVSRGRAR